MKVIVADTGPILHLHDAGAWQLWDMLGEVFLTPGVLVELRGYLPDPFRRELPPWARVATLTNDAREMADQWQQAGLLHLGEAEALALSLDMHPDWFLTDDAAARLMAESFGLETHGSLGVVLWASANSLIRRDEAEKLLAALGSSTLWVSPRILAAARQALNSIYGDTEP